MNRIDGINPANSEAYSYDSMGQIKSLQRGNFSESWNFDAAGNWLQYDKNGVVLVQDIGQADTDGRCIIWLWRSG